MLYCFWGNLFLIIENFISSYSGYKQFYVKVSWIVRDSFRHTIFFTFFNGIKKKFTKTSLQYISSLYNLFQTETWSNRWGRYMTKSLPVILCPLQGLQNDIFVPGPKRLVLLCQSDVFAYSKCLIFMSFVKS